MQYDSSRAEAMIQAAFGGLGAELAPDPDFGQIARPPTLWAPARSERYQELCQAVLPRLPALTVPEVLSLAVQVIGSVTLTEGTFDPGEFEACRKAVELFPSLRAAGYTAREIAHLCATLLAGLVLMFPGD